MNEIYYKLVRPDNNRLISLNGYSNYCLEYKVGEWTVPKDKNSLLYIFEDITFAKWFKRAYGSNTKLFECEVRTPIKFSFVSYCSYSYFWEEYRLVSYLPFGCIRGPSGTMCCEAVKLLTKVD